MHIIWLISSFFRRDTGTKVILLLSASNISHIQEIGTVDLPYTKSALMALGCDLLGISQMSWDGCWDWTVGMEGDRLFRNNRRRDEKWVLPSRSAGCGDVQPSPGKGQWERVRPTSHPDARPSMSLGRVARVLLW